MRLFFPRRCSATCLLLAGVFAGCPAGRAAGVPGVRLSPTYPTDREPRDPDRTLAKTARHATDVIAYSPDGRMLATAGADRSVRLWDARIGEPGTGALRHRFDVNSPMVAALAFSADGKILMALGEDQVIESIDLATNRSLPSSKTKAVPRNSVFRPGNDPHLAESTVDGLKLWNWRTGQVVREYSAEGQPIRTAAFTPDGRTVVGVTRGGHIWIWNVDTGAMVRSIATRMPVVALVASATHVATASSRGGTQVWPLVDGEPQLFGGNWPLAFSPDGRQVAATVERAVVVWDVATGRLLCGLEGHGPDIVAVAFHPNGHKIASADADGLVYYWTVPLSPVPPADLEKIKAALPAAATAPPGKPRRLLVFWRADGSLHQDGVPAVNHAIEMMGEKTGAYVSDFSRDYAALDSRILTRFDAIVLNGTSHLALPEAARRSLLDFVRRGGGVIGIHAAVDAFPGWPEGVGIIGASFGGQPWRPSDEWAVKVLEPAHPLLRAWGGRDFRIRDGFHEMAEPYTRADRRVLLKLDLADEKTSRPDGEALRRTDGDIAVAWIKRVGNGRVFYSGFGHVGEPFFHPAVLQFHLDGIQYALGDLEISSVEEAPGASIHAP